VDDVLGGRRVATAAEPAAAHLTPAVRFEWVGHVRAGARIAALLGVSLGLGAAALATRLLARARGGGRAQALVTRAWARAVARIVGMRLHVEGAPPPAPGLLVANHLGYVDVVALWCAAGGVFVAKSEVASWPLVGRLGSIARTLFIDRARKRDLLRVLSEMDAALRGGERVILFAEGTSTRGEGVLPFKSSLFEAAVRARLPVGCASLSYATPPGAMPADRAVCWWGDMGFPDHVYALLRLPGFEARLRFAEAPLQGRERKALARAAHSVVAAGFVRVVGAAGRP
jgi:1-acyl-sn-glycerol-3-phosphate acyltransferase